MKMKQSYPVEFRAEAVKLVHEQNLSIEAAARQLGIPKGTLANWVVAAKNSGDKPSPGARTVSELELENARLRKELADARQKRDIIKMQQRTLRRHHCPVCVDRNASRCVSSGSDVSGSGGIAGRILRLAWLLAVGATAGRRTIESGDSGGTRQGAGSLWPPPFAT